MMNALRAVLALALVLPSPALAADVEFGVRGEAPVVAPVPLPTNAITPLSLDTIKIEPIVNLDVSAAASLPIGLAQSAAQSASAPGRIAIPAQTATASAATALARTIAKSAEGPKAAAKSTVGLAASLAASNQEAGAPVAARLNAAYDASNAKGDDGVAAPVVQTAASLGTAPLEKPSRFAFVKKLRVVPALALATLAFATPALAQAAGPVGGPVITSAGSLAWLSAIHPLVAAGGAILGAAYGLIVSRRADGAEASAGEVLASVMRYGVIGGAGAFVLLDLSRMAFIGPSIGLKPLSAAVATAALGRTAFQGKFADPATTSADRIIGAFPAVAAAIGLSIGVTLAAPAISYQIAMTAMAATGLATAIFTALYKPGRSPADGPGLMGKGYVLQALMSGLALALSNWLVWPFAAMAVAGVALVAYAFIRELLSLIPKAPAK